MDTKKLYQKANVFTSSQFRPYFFFDKEFMTSISQEKLALKREDDEAGNVP
jgi:hypothetical protein